MRQRDFGRTGLSVSEVGVGCSRLGGMFSADSSAKEETALVHAAIDAGINFFDTADSYSQGQSEALLGRALRGRRDSVIIATKGGYAQPAQHKLLARAKPLLRPVVQALKIKRPTGGAGTGGGAGGGNFAAQDFSPEYLAQAVDGSLRRLGTDYLDIYQLHSPPKSVIEAGEYVVALERLQALGKIRYFGIGADSPDDVLGFASQPALASLQVPFSLLEQDARRELFPLTSTAGVGVISRSCFAAGLFNESLDEATIRSLTPDADDVVRLRGVARTLERPLLEAALQFNLSEPAVAVTILGMRTRAHLRGNLGYYAARPLDENERRALLNPS